MIASSYTYDPAAGQLASSNANDIHCWMIDINYTRTAFFAHRIHFPGAGKDGQLKRFAASLGHRIDPVLWKHALSTRSAPFPKPATGRIAVRIITNTHTEMTTVVEIDAGRERTAAEPPLPRQRGEGLAGKPSLRDGQAGQIGFKRCHSQTLAPSSAPPSIGRRIAMAAFASGSGPIAFAASFQHVGGHVQQRGPFTGLQQRKPAGFLGVVLHGAGVRTDHIAGDKLHQWRVVVVVLSQTLRLLATRFRRIWETGRCRNEVSA